MLPEPRAPMPFVVGSPRSGTTMLRLMLDAHPDLAIPPETGFVPAVAALSGEGHALRRRTFETITAFPPDAPAWVDFGVSREQLWELLRAIEPFDAADGVRAFYRCYADRFGKPRAGDKTPTNLHHLEAITQLLPEARFVHIIRDGRDVALSLRGMWFAPGRDIESLAAQWSRDVALFATAPPAPDRYLEVRFEDLVCEPRRELARVCAFLELAFDDGMLESHHRAEQRLEEHRERRRVDGTLVVSREQRLLQQARVRSAPDPSRIGVWRLEMSASELRRFHAVAGTQLAELGYEVH